MTAERRRTRNAHLSSYLVAECVEARRAAAGIWGGRRSQDAAATLPLGALAKKRVDSHGRLSGRASAASSASSLALTQVCHPPGPPLPSFPRRGVAAHGRGAVLDGSSGRVHLRSRPARSSRYRAPHHNTQSASLSAFIQVLHAILQRPPWIEAPATGRDDWASAGVRQGMACPCISGKHRPGSRNRWRTCRQQHREPQAGLSG